MPDAHPGPPPEPHYADPTVTLHHQPTDGFSVLASLPDASVDAVVTDPPYGLEFMGKEWDRPDRMGKVSDSGVADGTPFRRNAGTPAWGASGNPSCANCGGDKYRVGDRKCSCPNPSFPNHMAIQMRAFQEWCTLWTTECLRVLKPGGHLLAFGGTRTSHRLACAVEDAGFEIRDSIAWLYGSGFPKSLDVSKAIDKAAGAEREVVRERYTVKRIKPGATVVAEGEWGRQEIDYTATDTAPATPEAEKWQGWGTALKPAHEPIVVARKPLAGTVAGNVIAHGTGALNIDGCRVAHRNAADLAESTGKNRHADFGTEPGGNEVYGDYSMVERVNYDGTAGRWPANVVLDESQAAALDEQTGVTEGRGAYVQPRATTDEGGGSWSKGEHVPFHIGDTGGASRFLYVAKAGADERVRVNGVAHPTVKPLSLMRWLVRLVTPPGGTVLEPFAGSGTTVEACILEGFRCVAIEREADYLPLIKQRIHRRRDPVEAVKGSGEDGGLFDLLGEETA